MKTLPFLAITFLLFFNCSSDVDVQTAEMQPPLTDVLSIELSFGSKDVPDEFLLAASPRGLCVNDSGDVFVVDENRVKVFDKNGKDKVIIGGTGPGPGEFNKAGFPVVSTSGYLNVFNGYNPINVYTYDYKFIEKVNLSVHHLYKNMFKGNDWKSPFLKKAYTLNENERVAQFNVKAPLIEEYAKLNVITYEKNGNLIELARYKSTSYNPDDPDGGHSLHNMVLGELHFELLPDNRIIYTHAGNDITKQKDTFFYTLNILKLDDKKETVIQHRYEPVEVPKSIKDIYKKQEIRPERKIMSSLIAKAEYLAPIIKLDADGDFVFVLTNKQNENKEFLVDIFDTSVEKYITSVYFPKLEFFLPFGTNYFDIKNGFLHMLYISQEGFLEVQKYKIDPAVYGK